MFELSFFPLYGFAIGIHYSNDDLEEMQFSEDKTNIIQLYVLLVCVNVVWYTKRND